MLGMVPKSHSPLWRSCGRAIHVLQFKVRRHLARTNQLFLLPSWGTALEACGDCPDGMLCVLRGFGHRLMYRLTRQPVRVTGRCHPQR